MKNISEKIKKIMLSFTYEEQRKKELEDFKKKKQRFKKMSNDEIDFEYCKCKVEYEQKKMVLPLFLVSLLVATLMNWWRYFYVFVEQMLRYSNSNLGKNEVEMVQVVIVIFLIFMVIITTCIFIFIVKYVKKIYALSHKLLLIEDERNNRNIE